MISHKTKIVLIMLLLLTVIRTISPWAGFLVSSIAILWGINLVIILAILWGKKQFFNTVNKRNTIIVFIYLFWNIYAIIRGCFIAENYWEWKNLITYGFVFLLPLTIYFSTHRELVQTVFSNYIKYMLPAFFIFTLIMSKGAYGIYLIPLSLMLMFLPLIENKWKITIICFSLVAIFASFAARSNVIKFVVPLLLGLLYYLRPIVGKNILSLGRIVLMFIPFVFFVLGVTGKFNIFRISDYTENEYKTANSSGETEDLTEDTRTALYIEVINSAIVNDYIWIGRSFARGNDSALFGAKTEEITGTGKFERYGNEAAILNVFTWTGIIGVILYFLVFFKASYLALYKSKSWYMKVLAVYVCFRWCYAWVEDFSRFDLSYIFLWIVIGMCYSSSFRNMTDGEFKYWIRGIFDIRYRKATLKRVKVIEQS